MNAKLDNARDLFLEDLIDNNFTTYFAATHPKYSSGNPAFRFTSSPVSPATPWSWRYTEARQRLMDLSSLLTAEEAERRNINFVNPALKDYMPGAALPTLRGGIQLLLPGEQAYAHRHSANAFRLVLEAPEPGAYTNVEGYRLPMSTGDLICTPNWTWHEHHNESGKDVIWYDGLDVLMAFWIGGIFFEEMEEVTGGKYQAIRSEQGPMVDLFGPGLIGSARLFPDHVPNSNNRLLYYPYSTARKYLADLAAHNAYNRREGVVLHYVNPETCGPTFPSMDTSLRMIPADSTVEPMHRTENVIFVALEGSVTFDLPDDRSFTVEPFDVTAVPSWVPYRITNRTGQAAVLFSQSDRPLFQALGFYREELPDEGQ